MSAAGKFLNHGERSLPAFAHKCRTCLMNPLRAMALCHPTAARESAETEVASASLAEQALEPRYTSRVAFPPWDADRAHGQACP